MKLRRHSCTTKFSTILQHKHELQVKRKQAARWRGIQDNCTARSWAGRGTYIRLYPGLSSRLLGYQEFDIRGFWRILSLLRHDFAGVRENMHSSDYMRFINMIFIISEVWWVGFSFGRVFCSYSQDTNIHITLPYLYSCDLLSSSAYPEPGRNTANP